MFRHDKILNVIKMKRISVFPKKTEYNFFGEVTNRSL